LKFKGRKLSRGLVRGSKLIEAMGVQYRVLEDGTVAADFTIGDAQQGPPGYAHGGALASLIDEAMGAACWFSGNRGLSVHLGFDYKQAVPVGATVHVSGQVDRREGRKIFTIGSIRLADGSVAVSGEGIFVDAPQLLGNTSGFTLESDAL
jgi:uncharacterized protein (TIGR00369 family)